MPSTVVQVAGEFTLAAGCISPEGCDVQFEANLHQKIAEFSAP